MTPNAWHSCGRFTKEALFAKCDPVVLETYEALEAAAMEIAPFHVIFQKTRLCFQLRTRCVNGTPKKSYFLMGFLARKPVEHPRIEKVETFAEDQHLHYVRLTAPEDVDSQVREWLRLSTEYGEQKNRLR